MTGVHTGVQIRGLSVTFSDGTRGLSDVNFTIEAGRRLVILGAHESGKTTLLDVLAGKQTRYSGEIIVGESVLRTKSDHKSAFSLVPSDATGSLFIRTVWEYVTAPLMRLRISKDEIIRRGEIALAVVGMQHGRDERLSTLHFWCRRRVALAAVIAFQPQ
ncbi:MAG: energy-coupling factor ABC transporter ATP-binding protein, partial [Alicyclobacillus sp.]|nr:energy-coupling factor ABC transporter ATP-binding protein [Alicyclobacillus sp.]